MVLVIEASVSTAGHVSAGKGVNIDSSDEDSALLDEENAAERYCPKIFSTGEHLKCRAPGAAFLYPLCRAFPYKYRLPLNLFRRNVPEKRINFPPKVTLGGSSRMVRKRATKVLQAEVETDQAREEPDEIMDIDHDSESKFEKRDEHEAFQLKGKFSNLT
ncbi:hypothetical protein TNCV_2306531 [Trichonephila clavipes]|nr:hypothetical protein TNCV_2306531 [Trichonephila clavipes]